VAAAAVLLHSKTFSSRRQQNGVRIVKSETPADLTFFEPVSFQFCSTGLHQDPEDADLAVASKGLQPSTSDALLVESDARALGAISPFSANNTAHFFLQVEGGARSVIVVVVVVGTISVCVCFLPLSRDWVRFRLSGDSLEAPSRNISFFSSTAPCSFFTCELEGPQESRDLNLLSSNGTVPRWVSHCRRLARFLRQQWVRTLRLGCHFH